MTKKLIALIFAAIMVISTAFNAYATYYSDFATNAYTKGIDVSHFQGDIDWSEVASDGVQFAMIRTRYNGNTDPNFKNNMRNAIDNGINVGVYLYSTAQSVEESESDADFVINLIKDYPISYPVAIDIESTTYHWDMDEFELSAIIDAFCNKIKDAGYYPIVYANDYWIKEKLDMSEVGKWPIWNARYGTNPTYKKYEMWQASNTGSIAGIDGNVDLDFCYADYSHLIPKDKWMNINGETLFYRDYTKVTSDWINDGKGWYYIDKDGHYKTGWYKDGSIYYYLGDDGMMKTAWQKIGDNTFYLGTNGAMSVGLVDIDGKLYYFNDDGIMQIGIQKLNDNLYSFGADGAMQLSGQIEFDGKVYDINNDGVLTEYIPPQEETAAAQ